MTEFDELIQQQLKLADQMIYTKEEIQKLEATLSADEAMKTIIVEKKNGCCIWKKSLNDLLRMSSLPLKIHQFIDSK
jgi:hypothetical protein